jgi:DNA mismatch endonuclease, patch repair protein
LKRSAWPETDDATSSRMRLVRQRGTTPELAVRVAMRELGLGYRLNASDLPGSPDVVNRGLRKAIFVHGCYWHRHEGCSKATMPKRNRELWTSKFRANVERDRRKERELRALGFDVLTVWQCEVSDSARLRERIGFFWHTTALGTKPKKLGA